MRATILCRKSATEGRFIGGKIMTPFEIIRHRVLAMIGEKIDALQRHADTFGPESVFGRLTVKTLLSGSFHLQTQLMWWSEIKEAIESGDQAKGLTALERLAKHLRREDFYWTFIAPMGTNFWSFGFGPGIAERFGRQLHLTRRLLNCYR